MDIKEYKQQFDLYAINRLNELIFRSKKYTQNNTVLGIVAYSRVLFGSGGKRVRPYVFELAYKTAGNAPTSYTQEIALALELFHLFCLIHDDVIDESKVRHGSLTAHSWHAIDKGEKAGYDQAILLGDLLFSWANELFLGALLTIPTVSERKDIAEYFQNMIEEVVLGQMLDVDATTTDLLSEEELNEKTRLKTSGYTFVGPMRIGFCLAGKLNDYQQFTEEFGTALGMAYQIQDDMLDIISSEDILQKTTSIDVLNHQHTFFTHFIQHEAAPQFTEVWKELMLNPGFEPAELQVLFEQSGALEAGRKKIAEYIQIARSSLAKIDLDITTLSEWNDLILRIENRYT